MCPKSITLVVLLLRPTLVFCSFFELPLHFSLHPSIKLTKLFDILTYRTPLLSYVFAQLSRLLLSDVLHCQMLCYIRRSTHIRINSHLDTFSLRRWVQIVLLLFSAHCEIRTACWPVPFPIFYKPVVVDHSRENFYNVTCQTYYPGVLAWGIFWQDDECRYKPFLWNYAGSVYSVKKIYQNKYCITL